MSARLNRLLRPSSIAVIGGGFWCENVIRQCRKMGFDGPIWPVHPSRDTVAGESAVATVADLPAPPDAVFIGVNRELTVEMVRALSDMGVGGAVCFAAGFAEAEAELEGARDLQHALITAAGSMPFLGPNCYGFINYLDGALLWPDQQGGQRCESGVAIITQSSNIAINMTMAARGLDLAYVVTAGNQAAVDMAEIGAGLIEDNRVTALGLHIEGIGDLTGFGALAQKARNLGKPIVALKVGASEAARTATISHTASLAGSDTGATALFDRQGVHRTRTVEGFLEALKIAHITGPISSPNIASMSCSGGEASLMADLCAPLGLIFPDLSQTQISTLRAVLGPKVRLSNPLDYNTYIWPDTSKMNATFSAMMSPDIALGIVVLDFPRADRCSDADWAHVIDAVDRAAQATGKPMAVLASMAENLPEHWATEIARRGLIPLSGLSAGLEAVAAMIDKPILNITPIFKPRAVSRTRTLSEHEAKTLLATHGLPIPKAQIAATPEEAGAVATAIGFPVVLKGQGHAHKTEAGAVRIGLKTAAEVTVAAQEMGGTSWLVEQMITETVAELLIGITCDPAHGFVLTIGAGGQLTEIMADTQSLLLPANAQEVSHALAALRIGPLLSGYRGAAPTNRDAIIDAILAIQSCVLAAEGRIVEAEVNPLIAGPHTAIAADALIVMEDP